MTDTPGVTEGPFDARDQTSARRLVTRPFLCACIAYEGGDPDLARWRPCPTSLCQRPSHTLAHRVATSGRDYRYGGFRAWLRWIVRGIPADEEDC